jgi:hypothetical protein
MFDCEYSGLLMDMISLGDLNAQSDHARCINRINN